MTVAGQTAPGKGVLFRSSPFGMANDGITRFLRLRLGYHNGDTSKGLDGMGMAGNDYSIMDHCSVGWTIDEAFSSRNSKNITLQRTLISEALNCADHPNYPPGKTHGFAATIGGDIGSYHHNLLAHNAGRNWSLGGGLDGSGYAAGRSDIFNNVCYNWEGRTTDGGTHECNFVGNYYKMGPESDTKFLLTAQLEAVGKGTQSYYVNGNIRENKDGTLTEDKEGDTYNYQKADAVDLNWDLFVDKPFFESMATVEPARKAFKTVLSDVGASQPFFDEHDVRMVNETLNGTTSTKGCMTGMRGLVDRETDSEGFSYFVAAGQTRPAGYDTDQDGMPDWWEIAKGTNPDTPDNNEYQDNFGYTNLEQYLNWVAEPNFMMTPGTAKTVDLSSLFLGYNKNPWYTVEGDTPAGWDVSLDGSILTVSTSADAQALAVIRVSANDEEASGDDQKMLRSINFCSTTMAAGVEEPVTVDGDSYTVCQIYSVNGVLLKNGNDLSSLPKGIYILKAINGDRVKSVKVVNR